MWILFVKCFIHFPRLRASLRPRNQLNSLHHFALFKIEFTKFVCKITESQWNIQYKKWTENIATTNVYSKQNTFFHRQIRRMLPLHHALLSWGIGKIHLLFMIRFHDIHNNHQDTYHKSNRFLYKHVGLWMYEKFTHNIQSIFEQKCITT